VRELLKRTLEKDPRRRLRDIGDARLTLEDVQSGTGQTDAATNAKPESRATLQRLLPWALTAIATLAAVALGWRAFTPPPTAPAAGAQVHAAHHRRLARADGAADDLPRRPARRLRQERHVVGAVARSARAASAGRHDCAQFPFWSPDGLQVAYLTTNSLWRVGVDGSQPVRIATYRFSKGGRTPGGVWLADNTIVFAPAATGSGLLSVPAQGGEFLDYYKHDPKIEGDIHRPSLLPDQRTLLFVVDRIDTGADTIGMLANGTRKDILRIENETLDSPAYSPTGHILYHRETTTPGLWALPFSLERMEATGAPFLVEPQASYPSVAANGTMIFVEGSVSGLGSLAWLDIATGTVTPALKEQFPTIRFPKLSPDGRRVAAVVQSPDQGQVVIVADLQRQTHVRIAERADAVTRPTWRDDRTVIYGRTEARREDIMMRNADGSGEETKIGPA
jgi:Tol biopolymer transport system component